MKKTTKDTIKYGLKIYAGWLLMLAAIFLCGQAIVHFSHVKLPATTHKEHGK